MENNGMDSELTLAHGAGGEAYRRLVAEVFMPAYGSPELAQLGDSALCAAGGTQIAFTTDAFVVAPISFPGGDVGSLAVSGTVNDLAVSGAVPRWIAVSMILEAGLAMDTLRGVCASVAAAAARAGVRVVTGDTKVVERGRGDGIYITTSGVGTFDGGWAVPPQRVSPGDAVIVSAPIAAHGMAVMAAREKLDFSPPIESDARPLNGLIRGVLAAGVPVRAMRDPTRGGLGATVCEWAEQSGVDIILREDALPVSRPVRSACALLGMDPLFSANEGVCAFAVPHEWAQRTLELLHAHPDGQGAAIVGEATEGRGEAWLETPLAVRRRIMLPEGELLPRIC